LFSASFINVLILPRTFPIRNTQKKLPVILNSKGDKDRYTLLAKKPFPGLVNITENINLKNISSMESIKVCPIPSDENQESWRGTGFVIIINEYPACSLTGNIESYDGILSHIPMLRDEWFRGANPLFQLDYFNLIRLQNQLIYFQV
jgi:hypothetical protein